ncbi:MAG: PIN domain-containing protein [Bifidobacteriaceae bacterium]|jgi:predicted nucleic acid-binding protein|nr:PIN domain-containing protein [Bifidobacteriaceae bacterium]
MRSLDTNCALRWLLGDVPEQTRAVEQLLASGERFRLADLAMVEAGFALTEHYGLARTTAADLLLALVAHPGLVCDGALWSNALAAWRERPKLSLADTYLAADARRRGGRLLTFDRKLAGQVENAELVTGLARSSPAPQAGGEE